MVKQTNKKIGILDKASIRTTKWIGTPLSLILHTIFFVIALFLIPLGFDSDIIMLFLTTIVSLEAIYLAIFIQMTVNRNTESLEAVEEDIEDIQEDVEGLEDEVDEISEDIDEDEQAHKALLNMEKRLKSMQDDLEFLKKKGI